MKIFDGVLRKFHGNLGYDLVSHVRIDEKAKGNSEDGNDDGGGDETSLIFESEWQADQIGVSVRGFEFLEEIIDQSKDFEPNPAAATERNSNDAKIKRGGTRGHPVTGFVCVEVELGTFTTTPPTLLPPAFSGGYESENLALLQAIGAMEAENRTTLAELFSRQLANGDPVADSGGKRPGGGGANVGGRKSAVDKLDPAANCRPLIPRMLQWKIYPETASNNNSNLSLHNIISTKAKIRVRNDSTMIAYLGDDQVDCEVGDKVSMLKRSKSSCGNCKT